MTARLLKWIGRFSYRPQGSILIVAMWSLFFLGALAVALHAYVRPRLNVALRLKNRAVTHYLSKAGVKRAILEVENDATEPYDALKEPWSNNEDGFKEIELGGGTFSVILADEERKININKASYAVLRNCFEITGEITSQEAGDIAASIIDWRDEDEAPLEGGAESGYYTTLAGYPCKNKDFEVLEELLLVKGVTEELFNKAKHTITIYGTGAVNINTADVSALRSLGMSESLAEKIIHFRSGIDGEEATDDDNVFEAAGAIGEALRSAEDLSQEEAGRLTAVLAAGLLSVRSDNFRGRSVGEIKTGGESAEIIFVFGRDKAIRYWREE